MRQKIGQKYLSKSRQKNWFEKLNKTSEKK